MSGALTNRAKVAMKRKVIDSLKDSMRFYESVRWQPLMKPHVDYGRQLIKAAITAVRKAR